VKPVMPETPDNCQIIRTVRCPVCRAIHRYDVSNPFRPFCSERCRLIDLGQWLEEGYRLAGDPVAPEVREDE